MSQAQTMRLPVAESQSNVVRAEMQYYLDPPLGGGGNHVFIGTASVWRHKMDNHVVPINDMRSSKQSFTLDKQGFQIYKHKSVEKAFTNLDTVKTTVYAETAELLKQM
jgi:hypothetical protein